MWADSWGRGARCSLLLGTAPHFPLLIPRKAPPPLAAALTHEAVSQLLQTDLSEFRKLPREEEEEEEEDDDEEEKAPVTCEFSFF